MNVSRATALVERHGLLLVYPITNRREPRSLWGELHDDAPMVWTWDDESDARVAQLWHLRERLARSKKVVYAKWYQNRATFLARPVFEAMLATLRSRGELRRGLDRAATELLEVVEDDSPLSTRQLKARSGLTGRANESAFQRGLGQLFARQLVVGTGEVQDGAFPSLAVGATELIFEDLWSAAAGLTPAHTRLLDATFERAPLFGKAFRKVLASLDVP